MKLSTFFRGSFFLLTFAIGGDANIVFNKGILSELQELFSNLNEKIDSLNETLSQRISNVADNIEDTIAMLEDSLNKTLSQRISNVADNIEDTIAMLEDSLNKTLSQRISNVADNIEDTIAMLEDSLNKTLSQRISNVANDIEDKITMLEGSLGGKIDGIETTGGGNISDITQEIDGLQSDLNASIVEVEDSLADKISGVETTVSDSISEVLQEIARLQDALDDNITTIRDDTTMILSTSQHIADQISAVNLNVKDHKYAFYDTLDFLGFDNEIFIEVDSNSQVEGVHAADLDNDGDMDILAASRVDDQILLFENLGFGNFAKRQSVSSTPVDGAISVHTADINGDGLLDILSTSNPGNNGDVSWYENLGDLSFGPKRVISSAVNGAMDVVTADLDGDGDLDVVSASILDDKIAWYENLGNGAFGGKTLFPLLQMLPNL